MKTIKKGSNGVEVQILQYALHTAKKDGVFDSNLKTTVINFQSANKLTTDGIVGTKTWSAICSQMPTIRLGDRSDYVHVWQLMLNAVSVIPDSFFGFNTLGATKTYQSASGLVADGIVGKKTWAKAFGSTIESESSSTTTTNKKPVDYKQYDSKWGSVIYTKNGTYNTKQTIRNSGCGVTAMADVVATWWNKNITPVDMAKYSVKNGYRTTNSGTAWGFFKAVAQEYKASKFIQTSSYATAKNALSDGAIVVVSVGKSRWTKGGHYITWWKEEDGKVYINDPASASSSRAKAPASELKTAAKQFFIFYK